jgi:hypothetical protein
MVGQAVLTVCIFCAGSIEAHEDTRSWEFPARPAWRIAPEVSRYRYKEPGVMTNEGTLYGVVGSYTFGRREGNAPDWLDLGPNDMVRLEGQLSAGEVDYDGSFMDGTPLSASGNDDFLIDVRLLWGREWQPVRVFDAVYIGLGYRYLNDDSSAQIGGYERKSNYLYVPVGARKDFELTNRWDLSLTGEFDVLLIGRQISHLNDADPDLPTVRNWQWPGFGAGLSVDLRRRGRGIDFAFAPFLRYWWIAESDVSQGFYEPENNTFEYGLSFVLRF